MHRNAINGNIARIQTYEAGCTSTDETDEQKRERLKVS